MIRHLFFFFVLLEVGFEALQLGSDGVADLLVGILISHLSMMVK